MAGKVLEFSADKYFYAGIEEGIEEGKEEISKTLQEIIHGLGLEEECPDTILRLITDKEFRKELYEKCQNNDNNNIAGLNSGDLS